MKKILSLALVLALLLLSVSTAVAVGLNGNSFEVAGKNNQIAEHPAKNAAREGTQLRSGGRMIYSEYFEEFPEDWSLEDVNQDGYSWSYYAWSLPYAYEGMGFIGSSSYVNEVGAIHPDDYAITPSITLPDDADSITLSWWECGLDYAYYREHYQVLIGASPDASSLTTVLYEGNTGNEWANKKVDLSDYAGQTVYIAFRHFNSTDMFVLMLDCIEVYADVDSPASAMDYVYVPTNEIVDGEIYLVGINASAYYGVSCTILMSNQINTEDVVRLSGSTARTAIYEGEKVVFAAPGNTEWEILSVDGGFQLKSADDGSWLTVAEFHDTYWLSIQDSVPSSHWVLSSKGIRTSLDTEPSNSITYIDSAGGSYGPAFDLWDESNEYYIPLQLYVKTAAEGDIGPSPTASTPPDDDQLLFSEDFEQVPADWIVMEMDGDNKDWQWYYEPSTEPGALAHEGYGFVGSLSFDYTNEIPLTPDNYLFSPGIAIPANAPKVILSWYARALHISYSDEYFEVRIDTDMTIADEESNTLLYSGISESTWVRYEADITEYAGETVYISFRHCDTTDMFMLQLDTVEVKIDDETTPSASPSPTTEPTTQHKVTFVDWDDSIIDEQLVNEGDDAVPPEEPERDYWLFNEWDGDYTNVTNNIVIKAMYHMLGDVNMDNTVNTGDAALTLQYCVTPELLSEKQVKLADLNRDGKSNTGDAALVLQITVGLVARPW